MNTVFLDTSGLLAAWNQSDQWHAAATRAYNALLASKLRFVTTRYVLLECGNAAARTLIRSDVSALRNALDKLGNLIAPSDEDWDAAWQAYDRREAAGAGIVDQVSFVVMRRLGLTQAFTNDSHFKAAGFTTLF